MNNSDPTGNSVARYINDKQLTAPVSVWLDKLIDINDENFIATICFRKVVSDTKAKKSINFFLTKSEIERDVPKGINNYQLVIVLGQRGKKADQLKTSICKELTKLLIITSCKNYQSELNQKMDILLPKRLIVVNGIKVIPKDEIEKREYYKNMKEYARLLAFWKIKNRSPY